MMRELYPAITPYNSFKLNGDCNPRLKWDKAGNPITTLASGKEAGFEFEFIIKAFEW